MADPLTPEQRRRSMQSNRGRTRLELKVGKALWAAGLRYVTHAGYRKRTGARLPGSPDLVFSRQKVVVFVDGCFWHGCPVCGGVPQQSGEFWASKITANIERDARVDAQLLDAGWHVIRIREHEAKREADLEVAVARVAHALASD